MTHRICFVDVETTGLDPDRHGPWEIAVVSREVDGSEREHLWQVRPYLPAAEAKALEVGRFWTRFRLDDREYGACSGIEWKHSTDAVAGDWTGIADFRVAAKISRLLAGAYLAGANPAFDAAMLTRWLRAHGAPAPTWHHRLLDVEAYAAGAVRLSVPASLSDTADVLGIIVDREQQHGALYDAHLAKRVYDAAVAMHDVADERVIAEISNTISCAGVSDEQVADEVRRAFARMGGGARV